MATITITLSDDRLARFQGMADLMRTTPEEAARQTIEEMLRRDDEEFEEAVEYLLKKNAELLRRLAR
jgi:antitoxin FitA